MHARGARFLAGWLVASCFVAACSVADAAAVAAEPDPPRVIWPVLAADPPASAIRALDRLARACEAGDRAGLLALVAPAGRTNARALAEDLVSTVAAPRTNVRVEVLDLTPAGATLVASVLVRASVAAPAAGSTAAPEQPPDGFARAAATEAGLALTATFAADMTAGAPFTALSPVQAPRVEHVAFELTLDAAPARARCEATLTLADQRARAVVLTMGEGLAVRARGASVTLEPMRSLAGTADLLRVGFAPGSDTRRIEVDTAMSLPADARGGGVIYLPHQMAYVPFSAGGHFRFEATFDVPLPHRSASIGTPRDLPAEPGRRRTAWTCDRAVDYLPFAAAPYEIARLGEGDDALELWRTRDIGGNPLALLAELRAMTDWQEARQGQLPYRALRLVEAPVGQGYAVSYASVIFMTPGLIATRHERSEILSHEVGHQWWGNAVSPAPHARWASEGMADALRDLWLEHRDGPRAFLDRQDDHREALLDRLGAATRPQASSNGGPDAYDRGALFAHALRADVGDDVFWRILRRWYEVLAGKDPDTADFQREAESVAGRSLAAVFDPWLRTTALPVVRLSHDPQPGRAATVVVRLEQDEPAFPLHVPVRAIGASGEHEDWAIRLAGTSATDRRDLAFVPVQVVLDPDNILPRVREEEVAKYLRAEAEACLARGEFSRASALLARLGAIQLPSHEVASLTFAARVGSGEPVAVARPALDVVLAELPDDATRQRALLGVADRLMEAGAFAAALPIVTLLDEQVGDGAAVPVRLGLLLRAAGREDEAVAAFQRALARRPSNAAARAAIGLGGTPTNADDDGTLALGLAPLLATDTPGRAASSTDRSVGLALGGGRFAVLLGGGRKVLVGTAGSMKAVPGLSPERPVDMVALGTDTPAPRLVVLESERRVSQLTVIDVGQDGSARVVARHSRVAGGLRAALAADGDLLLASTGEGDTWRWSRWLAPLDRSTEGPDDDDGLERITIAADARLADAGTTAVPWDGATGPGVAHVPGLGLVVIAKDGASLAGDGGIAWEALGGGQRLLAARTRAAGGLALLVASDANRSPFAEDALPAIHVVIVETDGVRSLPLRADALDVSVAADGTLAVERRDPGCGPTAPEFLHGIARPDPP